MTANKNKLKPNFRVIIIPAFLLILFYNTSLILASENGHDFIADAEFIYKTIACGAETLPAGVDRSAVIENCEIFRKHAEKFRKDFRDKAVPFFAALRPENLPSTAVYPFGGSDMISFLATYPDARKFITISLETAGDPRRLKKAGPLEFREAVVKFRKLICSTLGRHDINNPDARAFETGIIPSQLTVSLASAYVYGYEPVSLRYFKIEDDGAIRYFSLNDIAGLENSHGRRLANFWVDNDFSIAFRNMELKLRRKGNGSMPPEITHIHIAANLDSRHVAGSGLLKYLESLGKISAMTKAASYLLWMDDFSVIRNYLLKNMTFMISDCTGILPKHALKAGFEQITYGRFNGAFLNDNGGKDAEELRAFWDSQPYRPIPFRYGYSDTKGANHCIITKPSAAAGK